MDSRQRSSKRRRLFRIQDGLCYWCQKPMVLERTGCGNGVSPDEYATFEHLNSEFKVNKRNKIVLAHYKCNQLKAYLEEKDQPLLEIWYRASDYGKHLEFVPSNLKYLF